MAQQTFHDGDIVRHPDYKKTRFRVSDIREGFARFDPVRRDGSLSPRKFMAFTGPLMEGIEVIVKAPTRQQKDEA